ncbi:MAG: pyridoxal phosphate-dependent aminotransferase [Chitinophagales bacterium]|nr:pyridoxal phosphate-dependent aminotransferase [Chitinophagales bacterium]MDW8419790.1 pyridoxal phosphate-dependent aminotransferase [Chitinophagales bacterium]
MTVATHYMPHLSDRIEQLQESATIRMAKLSRELKAQGHDIIDLSLGEPDFDTPQHIKDAAKKALDDGFTKYTPVAGYTELRRAISYKFKRDNNLDYSVDQIVVSTGAKQSIANAVMCTVNPGDEVLLPAPYWVSYAAIAQLAGGVCREIPTNIESNFKITAAQLESYITPRTRLLIYSSPCNPTGSVYTHKELREIAEVVKKHPRMYVIADEIYEYINFTGEPHASLAGFSDVKEQVITVNGFSKGFAMTGWRLGYIGAPLHIAKACDKMQGQFTSGTCSIAQKAGEAALLSDLTECRKMVDEFRKRRDKVYALLCEIPGLKVNLPDGAFYFFFDVSAYFGKSYKGEVLQSPEDISLYLLNEAKVALVSGEAFGDRQCVRMSYATSEEKLTEACRRLKNAFALLT